MKIYKIRWRFSEDKKPDGNRAKVSRGTAGCILPFSKILNPWNRWNSLRIYKILQYGKHTNLWQCMKYDESPQKTRSQPGIEQRFLWGQRVLPWRQAKSCQVIQLPCPAMPGNLWKPMKMYKKGWTCIKIYENPWRAMESTEICELRWKSSDKASLESSTGFYRGSRSHLQNSKPASMQSLSLFFQRHLQGALTSYHGGIKGWRGQRQRG